MGEVVIGDVFVDREDTLKFLEDELRRRKDRKKEQAIRITQAPGTGKTRLLQEFIKKMEYEKKGIGIYINSHQIEKWMNGIEEFRKILRRSILAPRIPEFVGKEVLISKRRAKRLLKQYNIENYEPYLELEDILDSYNTLDNTLTDFCGTIPDIIKMPIIIVFDEIQSTIGVMTEQFPNAKGQGLFRQIINLVADIIKIPNVLVILSGTNYKIIHFLEDIGSPLKQKTKEYNLMPLAPRYVAEFFDKIFGIPTDKLTEGLRNWLIENSNGVPRTMVWMAEALEQQGGISWAQKVGLENAISTLDNIVYAMIYEDVQNSVNALKKLKNGKEILEWVAYRSLFDRKIALVEAKQFENEEDRKNICTIEDLVHKGIIHIVDSYFELRNVYFEQALRDALQIGNKNLDDLLRIFGMKTTELRGFLSWQKSFLGAYMELALAIALYKISRNIGTIDLTDYLTPKPDMPIRIKVEQIMRIASPDLIIKPKANVIYAAPERGPDLTIFTEDKQVTFIECKNWTKPLIVKDLDKIYQKLTWAKRLFSNYKPNYIVAVPTVHEYVFDELERYQVHFMLEDSLRKILGESVFKMFDEIRQHASGIRKLV